MDAMAEYNLRPRSSKNAGTTVKLDSRGPSSERRKEKQAIKVRPAPLSKYRRKTANARERTRMQEINAAFERLQQVVPSFPASSSQDDLSDSSSSSNKQLTKITTLRLAMNYIRALSAILEEDKESTEAEIAARCPVASPSNCEQDFDTIDELMNNIRTPSPVLEHDPMLLCDCTDDDIEVNAVEDTQLDTQGLLSPTDTSCHFDFLLTTDDT